MFLRVFFILFIVSYTLFAKEYPQTFKQLGTPLYTSIDSWKKLELELDLKQAIKQFEIDTVRILAIGYKVDKTRDKNFIKSYLIELRLLKKEYEKLLYLLHKKIIYAIKTDNSKLFFNLTSHNFEGLLTNSYLRNKSLIYYKKNRNKEKLDFFEKIIYSEKLIDETEELFANEIVNASYDSKSTNRVKKSVNVLVKRVKNEIKVSFYNHNIYPITIRVKANYKALHVTSYIENEFVIKAKSSVKYAKLKIIGTNASYNYSWSWVMGSKYAKHDNKYLYTFPYEKGSSHMVSQGYNGRKTHKGNSAYSIDFVMPVGTKVCAAREGRVVKVKFDSNQGGYDRKYASSGNYVRIMHSDGTFATYYHLKQNGVLVKVGQMVSKGEALGYSGNTGYSSGPHLHFSVYSIKNVNTRKTIPTRFLSSEGVLLEPLVGHFYKAK